MIDWSKVTKAEALIVERIVDRAMRVVHENNATLDRSGAHMDICAAHVGCPLDLEGLLHANNFDFAHDVFGIIRHLDRRTGKLKDCFLPRYAINGGEAT